jgi:hypothetical protein
VRGTWQLQGYDVVGSDKSPKLISAVFDEGGNLMSLRIKLIKFSRLEDSIDMIDMDVLEEYINLNSYPKSEYIDVASSQDLGCKIYDCYYDYSASDVENISLENTEIVYLLNSDALESVLPVYKFTGKGQVYDEIEEIMVDVDVTVYANAVDPSKLYYNESED